MNKSELVVSEPSLLEEDGVQRISASIRGPGISKEIWFRSKTPFGFDSAYASTAFAAAGLFAAMREGHRLRIEAPMPGELLPGIERYQHINSLWYPEFRQTELVAQSETNSEAEARSADPMAWFFTGGVDSFYTYLAKRQQLTHAIFLHGADIKLHEIKRRRVASRKLQRAADEMGVSLIEVETNMLDFTDRYCSWGEHFHGAGLIATAMLFNNHFKRLAIASSDPVYRAPAWGSHPITDPLWSSPGFEVIHHGADRNRLEKTLAVTGSDLALRHLQVCWRGGDSTENCCECEKCLRTMVSLRIHGVLERCPTFPKPLDLSRVAGLRYDSASTEDEWWWNQVEAQRAGDPELAAALEAMREANQNADGVRHFARHGNGMLASPEWQRLLPKVRNKLYRSVGDSDDEWFAGRVVKSAESVRDETFDMLWGRHRKWLKGKLRDAERHRRRQRLESALRRLGIGVNKETVRRPPASEDMPSELGSVGHLLEPATPPDR